jgi:prepilin-type N-terminal cleavage/methylation domain-containing protein
MIVSSSLRPSHRAPRAAAGFTLTELAVVVLIVGLLLGGLLLTLEAQNTARTIAETRQILQNAHDAVIGFAVSNGRLPCPATAASNGLEDPVTPPAAPAANPCTVTKGFLPAATLGLGPTDAQGYLIDAWGRRVLYAVTKTDTDAYTTAGKMREKAFNVATTALLKICGSAGASAAATTTACPSGVEIQTPAVIFSTGRNGASLNACTPTAASQDELENIDGLCTNDTVDRVFVAHDLTTADATSGAFDDVVIWVSPNVLYHRMISAGAL